MTKKLLLLSLLTSVLLLIGCAQPPTAQHETITMKGSDTMVQLATGWAEAYHKVKPNVQVDANGGGTGTGFAALQILLARKACLLRGERGGDPRPSLAPRYASQTVLRKSQTEAKLSGSR